MKEGNIGLVKQAIINEFGISDELATFAAKAALEGVRNSLIMLADKLVKPKEEEEDEAD